MEPLVRAARVSWWNEDHRTLGRLGQVRILLTGREWIPPGLPHLASFAARRDRTVALLYATPADLEADRPRVSIAVAAAPAQGHGMEAGGRRFAVVHLPGERPHAFSGMEDALEGALIALERQGAILA